MTQRHVELELAMRAAELGEFQLDLVRDVFVVSPRLSAITGSPAGGYPASGGLETDRNVHSEDLAELRNLREAALGGTAGAFAAEFRHIRPDDGRLIWLRVSAVITRDDDGKATSMVGIVQDITQRRQEEEERHHLMAELDHRVKNVLATVQALAQQTAKRTTSLDGFLQNFGGRLKAMASANELLTAARWRGAAIDHLASAELGALSPSQTGWMGPELFLTPRAANALALAFHELATNAVKFGALSTETGRVEVRWKRTADDGFELTWTETGGPRVSTPARLGFGATLLEQVTGRELNGEAQIEYHPGGVRVRLRAGPHAVAARPDKTPVVSAARAVETIVASSGQANLKGARVLIVEDAVLLALELETGLSEAGAQIVGPAYELEEALALLSQPIDAAVLDANLNGLSVTPVAEALIKRGVPFVFATGYGESGGAPGGFDAPVIRKPYDVTQVAAAVAELLAAS